MKIEDKIDLLKQMGWKTHQGFWWTDSFDPRQNTMTLTQAIEYVFGKGGKSC